MPANKKLILNILGIAVLAISIPYFSLIASTVQKYLSKAQGTKANLVINTSKSGGVFFDGYKALAQGGEETNPDTLSPVITEIKDLSPKYIRVDHIYDFYDVASRSADGSLAFDFSKLDILVSDITNSGALPFLSLSYMPGAISSDGIPTSAPSDWSQWQLLVKNTVEHYSGKNNMGLNNVYYEVWNEPDLFGRWEINKGKDYMNLYAFAAMGAKEAQDVNKFYFGGPAITGAYPAWISGFIDKSISLNLPLDFVSWHFYGKDPNKISTDINAVDVVLARYPDRKIQKVISEWGIDSENNPLLDGFTGAAYTIAAINNFKNRVDLGFTFEIKDGLSPEGKTYWGRWGLLTHEKMGINKKPRYEAIKLLNEIRGDLLDVTGGGTFVNAIFTKENSIVKGVVYNYDPANINYELTPLTITGLENGKYKIRTFSLSTKAENTEEIDVTDGSLKKEAIILPNDIVYVELYKFASLISFTQGRGESVDNQSLELTTKSDLPVFEISDITESRTGKISLWFKPYWSGSDTDLNYELFNLAGAGGQNLFLRFQKGSMGNDVVTGFSINGTEKEEYTLDYPISGWVTNSWHNLEISWNETALTLIVDGEKRSKDFNLVVLPPRELQLKYAVGAIDDMTLDVQNRQILSKKFDANLN